MYKQLLKIRRMKFITLRQQLKDIGIAYNTYRKVMEIRDTDDIYFTPGTLKKIAYYLETTKVYE